MECAEPEAGPFAALSNAFSHRIMELRQLICMRIEETSKAAYTKDLQGLEASVKALERHFAELRTLLQREIEVVPKAKALLQACAQQRAHLQLISANLPARLPSFGAAANGNGAATAAAATAAASTSGRAPPPLEASRSVDWSAGAHHPPLGKENSLNRAQMAAAAKGAGDKHANVLPKDPPPKWYLTVGEYNGINSYMRGRLTLDKINACLDEVVAHCEATAKLMAAAKAGGLRGSAEERKAASELFHNLQMKEPCRGRHWFLETDLKSGLQLKTDKTGRAVLTLLRHAGRLQEVRTTVAGAQNTVYLLQIPSNC